MIVYESMQNQQEQYYDYDKIYNTFIDSNSRRKAGLIQSLEAYISPA